MGFFFKFREAVTGAFKTFSREAGSVLRSLKHSSSPLADRLLADAVRLAEIPSPTIREEQRVAFILERLTSLGISGTVDGDGNIVGRIPCAEAEDPRPLLLIADLGTIRWHPLESLSSINADTAQGAGLADALGAAALLSMAESVLAGTIQCRRDLLLLFAARSSVDPESGIFKQLTEDERTHPVAALGVRGFTLGNMAVKGLGTYRLQVKLRTDGDFPDEEADSASSKDRNGTYTPTTPAPPSAVDAAVLLARKLSGVIWDEDRTTQCRIRRIEAGTGFGTNPVEGVLDIELESSKEAVLEIAMKAAVATAQETGKEAKAKTKVQVLGYVPVGEPAVCEKLLRMVRGTVKEQHIRLEEYAGADPAAYLSTLGIPAVSIGMALGRKGLDKDEVYVESLEKGRKLLATLVERVSRENYP